MSVSILDIFLYFCVLVGPQMDTFLHIVNVVFFYSSLFSTGINGEKIDFEKEQGYAVANLTLMENCSAVKNILHSYNI